MPRLRAQSETVPVPRIDDVIPPAALPGGDVELTGANLGPVAGAAPIVLVDGSPAHLLMSRQTRLAFKVPDLAGRSRDEGTVYRVDAAGGCRGYAEGMGVATGAALDREGNLFGGHRNGTAFKINSHRQIFVHATLEPSDSAYHLAVNRKGTV